MKNKTRVVIAILLAWVTVKAIGFVNRHSCDEYLDGDCE